MGKLARQRGYVLASGEEGFAGGRKAWKGSVDEIAIPRTDGWMVGRKET